MEVETPTSELKTSAINDEDVEEGEVSGEEQNAKQRSDKEDGEEGEVSDEEKVENGDSDKKKDSRFVPDRPCPYFSSGRCFKGNSCKMLHNEPVNPMGNRGPVHPAAAMMMAAMAMRGAAPGNFMRPPFPGGPVQGRFPFPFPMKATTQIVCFHL